MQEIMDQLLTGENSGIFISVLVFGAAMLAFLGAGLVLQPVIETQRRLDRELAAQGLGDLHLAF